MRSAVELNRDLILYHFDKLQYLDPAAARSIISILQEALAKDHSDREENNHGAKHLETCQRNVDPLTGGISETGILALQDDMDIDLPSEQPLQTLQISEQHSELANKGHKAANTGLDACEDGGQTLSSLHSLEQTEGSPAKDQEQKHQAGIEEDITLNIADNHNSKQSQPVDTIAVDEKEQDTNVKGDNAHVDEMVLDSDDETYEPIKPPDAPFTSKPSVSELKTLCVSDQPSRTQIYQESLRDSRKRKEFHSAEIEELHDQPPAPTQSSPKTNRHIKAPQSVKTSTKSSKRKKNNS